MWKTIKASRPLRPEKLISTECHCNTMCGNYGNEMIFQSRKSQFFLVFFNILSIKKDILSGTPVGESKTWSGTQLSVIC